MNILTLPKFQVSIINVITLSWYSKTVYDSPLHLDDFSTLFALFEYLAIESSIIQR